MYGKIRNVLNKQSQVVQSSINLTRIFSKRSSEKIHNKNNISFCSKEKKIMSIYIFSIQLFRERLSGKVHATILKGIVGGFEFSFFPRNLKELARKAMEMCLRVLKESNKSRFDSYSRQEQCIDHIPYYLSGLSRAHVFRQTFSK